MKIQIRKAEINDATNIAKVHAKSFIAANREKITSTTRAELGSADYYERWKARLSGNQCLTYIAEYSQKVVGLITVVYPNQSTAEILYLYVDPVYWRHRIGKRLFSFVIRLLRKQKFTSVIIWVSKTNPHARAFYISQGAFPDGHEQVVERRHIVFPQLRYLLPLVPMTNSKKWVDVWQQNNIEFHEGHYNQDLLDYQHHLGNLQDKNVFIPFCGKSQDMLWFQEQGANVIGIELSSIAVEAFFSKNHFDYRCHQSQNPPFMLFKRDRITLFCGDFFQLPPKNIKSIDIVYDRGALVALPKETRLLYVNKLTTLIPSGCYVVLNTIEFNTANEASPPYSVSPKEIQTLYSKDYKIQLLHHEKNATVPTHLKSRHLRNYQRRIYLLIKR